MTFNIMVRCSCAEGRYAECHYAECRGANSAACIRHQCMKATVLNCHRCLINTGVEKMNNI